MRVSAPQSADAAASGLSRSAEREVRGCDRRRAAGRGRESRRRLRRRAPQRRPARRDARRRRAGSVARGSEPERADRGEQRPGEEEQRGARPRPEERRASRRRGRRRGRRARARRFRAAGPARRGRRRARARGPTSVSRAAAAGERERPVRGEEGQRRRRPAGEERGRRSGGGESGERRRAAGAGGGAVRALRPGGGALRPPQRGGQLRSRRPPGGLHRERAVDERDERLRQVGPGGGERGGARARFASRSRGTGRRRTGGGRRAPPRAGRRPTRRRSAAPPVLPLSRSGEMYASVPGTSPAAVSVSSSVTRARPKSRSLTEMPAPSASRTFDGLTSRWTIPRAWACARPSRICAAASTAAASSSSPRSSAWRSVRAGDVLVGDVDVPLVARQRVGAQAGRVAELRGGRRLALGARAGRSRPRARSSARPRGPVCSSSRVPDGAHAAAAERPQGPVPAEDQARCRVCGCRGLRHPADSFRAGRRSPFVRPRNGLEWAEFAANRLDDRARDRPRLRLLRRRSARRRSPTRRSAPPRERAPGGPPRRPRRPPARRAHAAAAARRADRLRDPRRRSARLLDLELPGREQEERVQATTWRRSRSSPRTRSRSAAS